MNKKETANKALSTYRGARDNDGNWGWPRERYAFEKLMHAIIDALPEEPSEIERKIKEMNLACELKVAAGKLAVEREIFEKWYGSKPQEEKESQPTSALPSDVELLRRALRNHGLECNKSPEEIIALFGKWGAGLRMEEGSADLGPQQPPNVASPAQPTGTSKSSFVLAQAQISNRNPVTGEEELFAEVRRKLRIMKSMEEVAHRNQEASFKCTKGIWNIVGKLDCSPINVEPEGGPYVDENGRKPEPEYEVLRPDGHRFPYKPGHIIPIDCVVVPKIKPEPEAKKLWEGEAWVHPETTEVVQSGAHMSIRDGWRRIKVKEVR